MTSAELFKEECRMHKAQFAEIDVEYPGFYGILDRVINTPPHENIERVWGLIFAKSFYFTQGVLKLSSVYEASDGETIFELYEQLSPHDIARRSILIFDDLLDQKQLLGLSMFQHTLILVKREDYIRIYHKGMIYMIENRNWKIYRPIDDYIVRMQRHYRELDFIQYRDILSFSFYELSLNKIGAIIVYLLNSKDRINNTVNSVKADINFSDVRQRRLLKNFLRYNDGAISINLENQIIETNVFLKSGPEADRCIKNYSGTRHTSAAKYSYENPDTIIVVVSADGPVSIFSDGLNIDYITVAEYAEENINDRIYKAAKFLGSETTEEEFTADCDNCGKTFHITAVMFKGWQRTETLQCPICGHTYFSRESLRLDQQLVKAI